MKGLGKNGPDYDPVAPDFGRQKTPGSYKRMGHHVIFQNIS